MQTRAMDFSMALVRSLACLALGYGCGGWIGHRHDAPPGLASARLIMDDQILR